MDYKASENYRNGFKDFLNTIEWEWFCTMNLESPDLVSAEKLLKKWRIRVCLREHVQVCYAGVCNLVPHPHIHLLMASTDRYGRTLADIEKSRAEDAWFGLTERKAVIRYVYDQGADGYAALRNMPVGKSEIITPYNKTLLEKERMIKVDPSLVKPQSIWNPHENDNIMQTLRREHFLK